MTAAPVLSLSSAEPRWATPRTPGRPTYGPAVAGVAAQLGRPLMPWQRMVADVSGEVDPDTGRMAYPLVVLVVPRRAGKTVLTLATLLQRGLTRPQARVWYTAQTGGDASKTLRDEWLPLIDGSPFRRHVRRRLSNGSEHVRFPATGSRIGVFTPTRTGLHGQDADTVVVDEAWAFTADHGAVLDAAIGPAQATRTGRQRFVVSAGGDQSSTWLLALRQLGQEAITGDAGGVAYFEWSADPATDDVDDPAVWARVHPAVGHTIDVEALASDRRVMDRAAFARGYLGIFTETATDSAIDPAEWAACRDTGAAASGRLTCSYDVALDGAMSSVVVASRRPDGTVVAELAHYLPGTADVAATAARMRTEHRAALVAPPDGPVTAVTAELRRLGHDVTELRPAEYAVACQELADAVTNRAVAHRGQRALDLAVAAAARRPVGDGWVWTRRRSTADIGPLVAFTTATHAARSHHRGSAPLIRQLPG